MASIQKDLDWTSVLLWIGLSIIGLIAIYSATQGPVSEFLPTFIQNNFWKQLLFVGISLGLLFGIQFINPTIFKNFSYSYIKRESKKTLHRVAESWPRS